MNFRPLAVFILSLILGIVLATFVFVSQSLKLVFIVFFGIIILCLISLIILFRKKFFIFIAVSVLLLTIPICQIYSKSLEHDKLRNLTKNEVVVSGRISENFKISSSGSLNFVLDDVVLIGPNFKKEINGKVSIYTSPNNFKLDELEIGTMLSAFCKLNVYDIENIEEYTLYNLSKNVVASAYVPDSDIVMKSGKYLAVDEKVRNCVYDKLKSFDIEYFEIGYAMMFGETNFIEQDILSSFRTTGIAHLLAVSGFHVTIIASIVSFILKRLKASNSLNFIIMTILLFVYSYLCNFSVSVVRASLMMILYLYLKMRGKCYDRLTALSFAGLVLLLANPINMFNVSFILSFMAVFSITVLENTFKFLFDKCMHKKMSNTLALIFAVQVGLIFVQLYYFKKYTPLSIVCNFISIPVSTIAFNVLIIGTLVSFIIPFMSFISVGYDYLMGLIVKFNYTLSKINLVVSIKNLNFLIIIFGMIIMLILSNFIFSKKRYKAVGVSVFLALSTILLFV